MEHFRLSEFLLFKGLESNLALKTAILKHIGNVEAFISNCSLANLRSAFSTAAVKPMKNDVEEFEARLDTNSTRWQNNSRVLHFHSARNLQKPGNRQSSVTNVKISSTALTSFWTALKEPLDAITATRLGIIRTCVFKSKC